MSTTNPIATPVPKPPGRNAADILNEQVQIIEQLKADNQRLAEACMRSDDELSKLRAAAIAYMKACPADFDATEDFRAAHSRLAAVLA